MKLTLNRKTYQIKRYNEDKRKKGIYEVSLALSNYEENNSKILIYS